MRARAATDTERSTSQALRSPARNVFALVRGNVPVVRSHRAVPPEAVTVPLTALARSPAAETVLRDSARE